MVTKKTGFSRVAPALAVLGASLFACNQASAAISGTVDVSLLVSEYGCEVGVGDATDFATVEANADGTMNIFGTLNFGQVKGGNWNYALSAELLGQAAGRTGPLVVLCDLATGSTAEFTVAVDGGKYLSGSQRNMVLSGVTTPLETQKIAYGVYQDTARSQEYFPGVAGPAIDAPNGEAVKVPLYGAVKPNPAPNAAKEISDVGYQDTLVVTIDFSIQ